jgi:hypothetical protein
MEIICIDDKFPSDALEFYRKFGVEIPKKSSIYTIRDKITHITGDVGLLLNEIVNPLVPINTSFGVMNREVTWNIKRFTTLLGLELTKEMVLTEKYVTA